MPIPDQIATTWDFLHREVVWLHGRWMMFEQLYAASEARVDALNRVAPTFFAILQGILVDEVQLTLCRLADPARIGRRENLTLETLTEKIEQMGESSLARDLRQKLEGFRLACDAIVIRRNRRIAHYDFHTHQPAGEGLAGPSRAEIKAALESLRVYMRAVYQHFANSHMAYEHFAMNDDANSLIRAVAEALRYRELQENGQIPDIDLVQSRVYQSLAR
jgi:hypothetical protein